MPVWVLVKPARRTLAVRAIRTSSGSARPALLIETRGRVAPGLSPLPAGAQVWVQTRRIPCRHKDVGGTRVTPVQRSFQFRGSVRISSMRANDEREVMGAHVQ